VDDTQRVMLAYSSSSRSDVRLPSGSGNTSLINIVVEIRDVLNCVTEYRISPVIVKADSAEISSLLDVIQQTDVATRHDNPTVQLLASGSTKMIGQIVTSISQVLNEINTQQVASVTAS
jgi:hypothetical protein